MRNIWHVVLIVLIGLVIGLIIWTNGKNNFASKGIKTDQPLFLTIEQKRLIAGNLYPLTEIELKSPISGTLEKIYVNIGDKVVNGDEIAQIKLVPDPSKFESAKSNLNLTTINFENQQKIYDRNKILFERGVISYAEFEDYQKNFYLIREQFLSAQNQLTLIRKGFVKSADLSNIVKATTSGAIIDLPLKEGSSVIERSNFSNGTTIAVIARLDTFIFRGKVNETDMVYLHQGMRLSLNFNAYKSIVREAILDKISAKGVEELGVMKYYIEARFGIAEDSLILRSGYSANAEIILQKRVNVLAIQEKFIHFQNDSAYLTIIKPDGKPEKRFIDTGLSDGINIEVIHGLNQDDKFEITDKTDHL